MRAEMVAAGDQARAQDTTVDRVPEHVVIDREVEEGAQVHAHEEGQAATQPRVLTEADAIVQVAQQMQDPEAAILRLGIFPTLGPYLLPHVVPKIRETYPSLRLQLAEEKTEVILTMLRQGELDAGLLALPINDEGLEMETLFEEPFVVAMPAEHPLAENTRITMEDLDGTELLLLEEGHCLREHALEVCALAGAHERVDFHATSMETLRQMVAANVGVTLMPLLSVKPPIAETANMVIRPFADPAPARTIALVWRGSSALSAFLRELATSLRTLPPKLLQY